MTIYKAPSGWVHDELMEAYDLIHALVAHHFPHNEQYQILVKLRDSIEHADLEIAAIAQEQSA